MKRKTTDDTKLLLEGQRPDIGNGRTRITLTATQREQLARNRQIEEAVAMFLDLDVDRTNAQIADQLGLSKDQLKRLTQTDDFRRIYESALIEVGHSPRLGLTKQAIDEMLPLAARTVRSIMTDGGAPAGVRLKAAELVLGYAEIKGNAQQNQVEAFKNFMSAMNVRQLDQQGSLDFAVPAEFTSALADFVDGEAVEIPASQLVPG